MISNEQRAHDIAIALLSKKNFNSPVDAYHEYINVLLPVLKEIDKTSQTALLNILVNSHKKRATLQRGSFLIHSNYSISMWVPFWFSTVSFGNSSAKTPSLYFALTLARSTSGSRYERLI